MSLIQLEMTIHSKSNGENIGKRCNVMEGNAIEISGTIMYIGTSNSYAHD